MNCLEARFRLYAYLDRELSRSQADELERHLEGCQACSLRARSARGLADVLRDRVSRPPAPDRLRLRIRNGTHPANPARTRAALGGLAAAIVVLIVPLVADGVPDRAPRAAAVQGESATVSKHFTGTLVCLHCEARKETGLCDAHPAGPVHDPAFCTEDGEIWRLLPTPRGYSKASIGQTMTVEGVAFPQSGFLRASRAGY